jgi:hypothetical protein
MRDARSLDTPCQKHGALFAQLSILMCRTDDEGAPSTPRREDVTPSYKRMQLNRQRYEPVNATQEAPAAAPKLTFSGFLGRLESAATQPVLPGEMTLWADDVTDRLKAVGAKFDDWELMQQALHREVARRDPALLHRTDGLRQRMSRCRRRLERLETKLDDIVVDPKPGAYRAANGLRDDVLDWIIDVKALDREATTWWSEALYRDRGVAD